MASNLRRSKRTVGKRITEIDKKVERLRKANIPTRVGDHTIVDDNLAADINANKIVAGTIDASVINVTNINANNVNAGILSGIEIRGGTPVGGVYPFRVDTGGNLTSTSGSIGAFDIGYEALTAATFGSMPFDTTGSLSIGVDGEIIGTTNVGSFYGTPYYTTVTINANDGSGIIVAGDASGGYLESRIRSSFIETNQLFLPGGDVQTQLNGKAATSHTSHTRIRTDDGTAATPAYSFTNDVNTGFYSTADGVIGFSSNGSLRFRVGSSFFDLSDGPIGITGASSISSTGNITGDNFLADATSGTFRSNSTATGTYTRFGDGSTLTGAFRTENGTDVYSQTVTTRAVYINSNGTLGTVSSSLRYKEDVEPISVDYKDVLKIEPVTFYYKQGIGDPEDTARKLEVGVIAEQVEEIGGLGGLLIYDNEVLETFKYDKLPVYLLAVCQEQEKTIESLSARIAELESKM